MAEIQLDDQGKPPKESYKDAVFRLTEQVYSLITRKYGDSSVFDILEYIIQINIEVDGIFECSQYNLTKKILAVHDVEENPITNLLIGPYLQYRDSILEKFSNRVSSLIYEMGMKNEIIDIMFAILIKEMKRRFGNKKSGYIFTGVEGIKDEGIIKIK